MRGIQCVTAHQRQGYEWREREWKGLERTLILLEEKVSKNDLNGKKISLSLSVSRANIALHVMQRQCSSMLGMSNLEGKLLPLVLSLGFLAFISSFSFVFSPLAWSIPHSCHKATSEHAPVLRGDGGTQGAAASNHNENNHWSPQNDLRGKTD